MITTLTHEDILSLHATLLDSFPNINFVPIHLRGVDVSFVQQYQFMSMSCCLEVKDKDTPVAMLEGSFDGGNTGVILVYSKPKGWYFIA